MSKFLQIPICMLLGAFALLPFVSQTSTDEFVLVLLFIIVVLLYMAFSIDSKVLKPVRKFFGIPSKKKKKKKKKKKRWEYHV